MQIARIKQLKDTHVENYVKPVKPKLKYKYVVNQEQYEKFEKVRDYFIAFAESHDGRITANNSEPEELFGIPDLNGHIGMEIPIFTLNHGKYKEFLDIAANADAITIDSIINDTVSIELNVNNVWKRVIINE